MRRLGDSESASMAIGIGETPDGASLSHRALLRSRHTL